MTEVLFTGRRLDATMYEGVYCVSRIVCPDHPEVRWWTWIDQGKQIGEAYVGTVKKLLSFSKIEIWMDQDALNDWSARENTALTRAMQL